jgi:hypothetical protein
MATAKANTKSVNLIVVNKFVMIANTIIIRVVINGILKYMNIFVFPFYLNILNKLSSEVSSFRSIFSLHFGHVLIISIGFKTSLLGLTTFE